MFQSPVTPSPSASGRSVAATVLRGAGLIDRDERMRDVSDKQGGKKTTPRHSHRSRTTRTRAADAITGSDPRAAAARASVSMSRNAMRSSRMDVCFGCIIVFCCLYSYGTFR